MSEESGTVWDDELTEDDLLEAELLEHGLDDLVEEVSTHGVNHETSEVVLDRANADRLRQLVLILEALSEAGTGEPLHFVAITGGGELHFIASTLEGAIDGDRLVRV